MKPSEKDLKAVGDAMITLTELNYVDEELAAMNTFLEGYAQEMNDIKMNAIFTNLPEAMNAFRILHQFAFQFQNEEDIIAEFQEELDEVALRINYQGGDGNICV